MRRKNSRGNRPPAYIKLVTNSKGATGDSLDLFGTELGNDRSPLTDGGRTDAERPRDIRGALKVINNVLLEHEPSLTVVHSMAQPQSKNAVLTSVQMTKLETLADRLVDAMKERGVNGVSLAAACGVTSAAVTKWLKGGKMNADNLAAAARALGVSDDWLRTGRLPRDREGAEEDHQIDRIMGLLNGLQAPLLSLTAAIEALNRARAEPPRKRSKP